MKHLLIIFNVLFLLVGNVLFLNAHHSNDHIHETHNTHECAECISLNNSNNYISEFNDVNGLQSETLQLALEYSSTIVFKIAKIFQNRAPPPS